MGIETILVVGLVVVIVAVVVGLGRARRKANRTHTSHPSTGPGGPRH